VAQLELTDLANGLSVTVSIGLALRELAEELMDWIERADRALYKAKEEGRNCIVRAAAPEVLPDAETSIDTDRIKAPSLNETSAFRAVKIGPGPTTDEVD